MATPKRLYVVTSPDGAERLVNATSPSSAINAIARPGYLAEVASPNEVARILTGGGKIVEANPEPAAEASAEESAQA